MPLVSDHGFAAFFEADPLGNALHARIDLIEIQSRDGKLIGQDETSSTAFEVGGSDGANFTVRLRDHQIGFQTADQFSVDVIQRLACADPAADFQVDFTARDRNVE